ncbi:hypothetical protein MY11210_007865 [Beauveria gryllotalpidicola]
MGPPGTAASFKPTALPVPIVLYSPSRHRCFNSSSKPTLLPQGSWDSHMHVIDFQKYPLRKKITKSHHEATLGQALANAKRLGLPNMVFVQVSTYGNDNTWVLDALKQVGPAAGRGVVAFDPERVDAQTLEEWHRLGVRGVRLNLRSSNTVMSRDKIQTVLRKYAEKLRPMKTWSIGLYADMEVLDHVQPLLPELSVKMVLEHFASPASLSSSNPARLPGWDALTLMMQDPRVYVKISAPYLFSNDPELKDLAPLAKSLFKMRNGQGVVFGSDWPHTKSPGYDATSFIKRVVEWCDGNEKLQDMLFRDNAKTLWDV